MKAESPSQASIKSNSLSSLSLIYLANSMHKSSEWLDELREIHYVPYNSCNSLTVYSYKYWKSENKFLVATKANNLKEFCFKSVLSANEDLSLDNTDFVFSNRSSVSSTNSNPPDEFNATSTDEKSTSHNELMYLEPHVKIHQFSKIKNEGLISSIDVLEIDNFSIFVVSFALKRKPVEKYFVQIYCDFETSNLELILECCQEFELDSMPHRVTNISCMNYDDTKSTQKFIMVNCSKRTNVFFSIDIKNRKFEKVEKIENIFLEFEYENIPDNCTSHDMKYLEANNEHCVKRRLTAIGCQNGWLGVFVVDSTKNELLDYWDYENDSFITQLHFFTTKSIQDWSLIDTDKIPINLLVLRSLEPTRIFNNVLNYENNSDDYQDLEINNFCDLVTSAIIYDATFSGYNSIVLGTFGKYILFYSPIPINLEDSNHKNKSFRNQKFHYEKKREFPFKHSVMGLCKTQLSGNGAFDLVILTLNGLSIWQYCPERLAELVNQKFEENEQTYLNMISSLSSKN